MHVLGIDVGGTKTVCLLANEDGAILAEAREAGANLQGVGELALEKVLHSAMILIVNDALIALQAGIGDAPGIVVVSGTGSIAYGRNARGEAARAGGWGYVLGDEGSGYWIGRFALRAVVRHADGRGRETSLTSRLLGHFDLTGPSELIHKVYHQELAPSAIGALAHYVQEARDDGDLVAAVILDQAAEELAATAAAVMKRLEMDHESFSFVLAGGMFHAVPWLCDQLNVLLRSLATQSRTIRLEEDPALGAVQLALAVASGRAKIPAYRPSL